MADGKSPTVITTEGQLKGGGSPQANSAAGSLAGKRKAPSVAPTVSKRPAAAGQVTASAGFLSTMLAQFSGVQDNAVSSEQRQEMAGQMAASISSASAAAYDNNTRGSLAQLAAGASAINRIEEVHTAVGTFRTTHALVSDSAAVLTALGSTIPDNGSPVQMYTPDRIAGSKLVSTFQPYEKDDFKLLEKGVVMLFPVDQLGLFGAEPKPELCPFTSQRLKALQCSKYGDKWDHFAHVQFALLTKPLEAYLPVDPSLRAIENAPAASGAATIAPLPVAQSRVCLYLKDKATVVPLGVDGKCGFTVEKQLEAIAVAYSFGSALSELVSNTNRSAEVGHQDVYADQKGGYETICTYIRNNKQRPTEYPIIGCIYLMPFMKREPIKDHKYTDSDGRRVNSALLLARLPQEVRDLNQHSILSNFSTQIPDHKKFSINEHSLFVAVADGPLVDLFPKVRGKTAVKLTSDKDPKVRAAGKEFDSIHIAYDVFCKQTPKLLYLEDGTKFSAKGSVTFVPVGSLFPESMVSACSLNDNARSIFNVLPSDPKRTYAEAGADMKAKADNLQGTDRVVAHIASQALGYLSTFQSKELMALPSDEFARCSVTMEKSGFSTAAILVHLGSPTPQKSQMTKFFAYNSDPEKQNIYSVCWKMLLMSIHCQKTVPLSQLVKAMFYLPAVNDEASFAEKKESYSLLQARFFENASFLVALVHWIRVFLMDMIEKINDDGREAHISYTFKALSDYHIGSDMLGTVLKVARDAKIRGVKLDNMNLPASIFSKYSPEFFKETILVMFEYVTGDSDNMDVKVFQGDALAGAMTRFNKYVMDAIITADSYDVPGEDQDSENDDDDDLSEAAGSSESDSA